MLKSPKSATKVLKSPKSGTKVLKSPKSATKVLQSPKSATKAKTPKDDTKSAKYISTRMRTPIKSVKKGAWGRSSFASIVKRGGSTKAAAPSDRARQVLAKARLYKASKNKLVKLSKQRRSTDHHFVEVRIYDFRASS